MTTRLIWWPALADDLPRLSANRRLIWVSGLPDGAAARHGHAAELPPFVPILEALVDYGVGPGADRGGVVMRWQVWECGQMYSSE
jgi:hypothetical protein